MRLLTLVSLGATRRLPCSRWLLATIVASIALLMAGSSVKGDSPTSPPASIADAVSPSPAGPAAPVTGPTTATVLREPRLVQSDGWDAGSRRTITDALARLPARLRSELGNATLGPLSILVNGDGRTLSGSQPYGEAANFYSTNEGDNEVILYPNQGLQTVLHELGHAYNLRHTPAGRYALVYLDDEMQSFVDAAGWRLDTPLDRLKTMSDQSEVAASYKGDAIWPRLSRNDPLEDFANSFALFYASPSELLRLSAVRYAWFVEHLGPLALPAN